MLSLVLNIMKAPRWLAIVLTGLLAGCAGIEHSQDLEPVSPSFESHLFSESPGVSAVADIFSLSEKQQHDFLEYFNHPSGQNIPAHQRVYDYLEAITTNFTYQGETFTASSALNESSGNCLSLAILTTALAKLGGVETGYQLVDSTPVFESHGSVIYKGLHVRTKLYDPAWQPKEGFFTLSRPGLLVDYFPSDRDRFISNINETEYTAMYYNNLAGEAISREDYSAAYWLLRKSLGLTPDNASAINSMAIVYRRMGDVAKSEQIYQYGIRYLPNNVSLLRNYRVLLKQQERFDEVEKINKTLAQIDDSSPFDWLHAGQRAYNNGEFKDAVFFYKKAVEIAPYLHESYAGMAKAYYQLGDRSGARRELINARKFSNRQSIQSMYQAKLMALTNNP